LRSGASLSGGFKSGCQAKAADGSTYFIGTTNGLVYKGVDGANFGTNSPAFNNGTESFSAAGAFLGYYGSHVSKDGFIFFSSESDGKIRVSRTPHVATTYDTVKLADGSTDFEFTIASSKNVTLWNWSWEEVEFDWQATGGLELGDIIVKTYHRSADSYRFAYLFVMRYDAALAAGSRWLINADGTALNTLPDNATVGVIPDPFSWWNSTMATRYRHLHDGRLGTDGYFYFATGDYLMNEAIASSTNTNGAPIVISKFQHRLKTGDPVYIYDHLVNTAANGDWSVDVVDGNTFRLKNAAGTVLNGNGGGVGGATGYFQVLSDFGNHNTLYRFHRIKPGDATGATYEDLTPLGDQGYTCIMRRADGAMICGNDFAETVPTAGRAFIDIWKDGVFIKRAWTAEADYLNWPIFSMAQHENGRDMWAIVRRAGGAANGAAFAQLLHSSDAGDNWKRIILSGGTTLDINYCDLDRFFTGRNYTVWGTRLVMMNHIDYNLTGMHWTLDI
jgi:hypothetical protein